MGSRDQRRIIGPDRTVPYAVYQQKRQSSILRSDGTRCDNREFVEIQPVFMAVDVISQAKGSALLEVGNTKVICGVFGPRELHRGIDFKLTGQVCCEVKFAPFSSSLRKNPQPDRRQRDLSRQLKEALEAVIIVEKYPKAVIDINITVIEDGGSVLSTCLTAAGLALCHASIDVHDLIVGASVIWNEAVACVDPTREEEECLAARRLKISDKEGSLTMGMMPKYANGQVTLMVHEGELQLDTLTDGIQVAIDSIEKVYSIARQTLLDHGEKVYQRSNYR